MSLRGGFGKQRPRHRLGRFIALAIGSLLALTAAGAAPAGRATPTTSAAASAATTFAGNWADPAASFRPKYRWWQPLAATDDQELRNELSQIAANGGGGAEVVAFQVTHAGGPDWGVGNSALQTYGYGTPTWSHKIEVMAQAARDSGIAVDLTNGPYWPVSTPDLDTINDPREMQQLVFAQQFVPAGTARSGPLPTNNSPALPTVSRTLCGATAAGATTIPIANDVGGYGVGDTLVVGTGGTAETVTITQKGSAGACTTLSAAAVPGATNIKTALNNNFLSGETLTIGTGATQETVTILAPRGTTGANGTGLNVTPALLNSHASGEPVVQRTGTGLTVAPALANPHSYGETAVDTARSTIVAVLVARCVLVTCNTQGTGSRLLDRTTIQDVTAQVDPGGNLAWTAPADGGMWNVIVFRQTSANNQAGIGGNLSFTQPNGTVYAVDHLGKAGTKAATDYWDAHIFTPATLAAIAAIGRGDLFEDSLELAGNLKWTSTMVDEWKTRRGYDPTLSLPALANAGRQGTTTPFYDFTDGARVRNDYQRMWSDLYIANHLVPMRQWAATRGLQLRVQAYGDPVDTPDAAAHVDTPEGESFGFGNSTERYKTVTTGAHFSSQKVTSTESHASNGNVWNSVAKGNGGASDLFAFYRAFGGGVTQIVYHGFPYLETPPDTGPTSLWPGFSFSGNTSFSEAWGPRMPQWEDWGTINDNLGRLQLILREGKPRFDVGVYFQQFTTTGGLLTSTSPLHQNGYTDDYVSPAFLRDASATYQGGELFKDQWGFRALLLNGQATMPVDIATKLVALATQGLPVVIVGTPPSASPGAKDPATEDAAVQAAMTQLTAIANVKTVAALTDVPAALVALGVKPAMTPATVEATAPILDIRRQTPDVDYYFLLNQSNSAVQRTLTLTGAGTPYRLDTWAATATPIAGYTSAPGTVTVPVRLGANNVAVIAVTNTPAAIAATAPKGPYATATTADEAVYSAAGALAIRASAPGTYTTTRSDGAIVTTKVTAVPGPFQLTSWSLAVDGWSQPSSNKAGENKHTSYGPFAVTPVVAGNGSLPAWSSITPAAGYPVDLTDVSGIGTYTTTLSLPAGAQGGYLNLGNATDTVRLTVNGQVVPVDEMDISRIDLGRFLHEGDNTVVVRVSSTLLNAVRVGAGTGAQGRARNTTYGLTGPVVFTPYAQRAVDPVDQLGELSSTIDALSIDGGLKTFFKNKIADVQKTIRNGQNPCAKMDALLTAMVDKTGKTKSMLTVSQSKTLLQAANETEVALGCLASSSPKPKAEADEMDLLATIDGMNLSSGEEGVLNNLVHDAAAATVSGAPCPALQALVDKINADKGKKNKLTVAQANTLLAAIGPPDGIRGPLGC